MKDEGRRMRRRMEKQNKGEGIKKKGKSCREQKRARRRKMKKKRKRKKTHTQHPPSNTHHPHTLYRLSTHPFTPSHTLSQSSPPSHTHKYNPFLYPLPPTHKHLSISLPNLPSLTLSLPFTITPLSLSSPPFRAA